MVKAPIKWGLGGLSDVLVIFVGHASFVHQLLFGLFGYRLDLVGDSYGLTIMINYVFS